MRDRVPERLRVKREPQRALYDRETIAAILDEASAKVRTGPEEDEPEDLDLPVWAGVVPVHLATEPSEYDWRRVRDGRLGPPHSGG